jgi:hypothetical protein
LLTVCSAATAAAVTASVAFLSTCKSNSCIAFAKCLHSNVVSHGACPVDAARVFQQLRAVWCSASHVCCLLSCRYSEVDRRVLLEEVRESLNKKTSATYATYARKWMVSGGCILGKQQSHLQKHVVCLHLFRGVQEQQLCLSTVSGGALPVYLPFTQVPSRGGAAHSTHIGLALHLCVVCTPCPVLCSGTSPTMRTAPSAPTPGTTSCWACAAVMWLPTSCAGWRRVLLGTLVERAGHVGRTW